MDIIMLSLMQTVGYNGPSRIVILAAAADNMNLVRTQPGSRWGLLGADSHNDGDHSQARDGSCEGKAGRLPAIIAGEQVLMCLELKQQVACIPANHTLTISRALDCRGMPDAKEGWQSGGTHLVRSVRSSPDGLIDLKCHAKRIRGDK